MIMETIKVVIQNVIKNEVYKKIIPWLFLTFVLIAELLFFLQRGAAYIDSDMAADVIGAKVMLEEHALLSKNWWYSTGLVMFGAVHANMVGLLISPNNWIVARTIGSFLLLAILILSYLYVARALDKDVNKSIVFATLSICPIGYLYFEFFVFGSFYVNYAIFSLLLIGTLLLFIKENSISKKQAIVGIIKLILLGIIMGLTGMKYAVFPIGPLLLTSMIVLWRHIHVAPSDVYRFNIREYRLFFGTVVTSISFAVGMVINMLILSKHYSFQTHTYMEWGELDFYEFFSGLSEYLSQFGYQWDQHIWLLSREKSVINCFSLQGIANLVGIAMALAIVFSAIRLCLRVEKLNFASRLLVILFFCALFVGCVMFKLTRGFDACTQYWSPMVAFTFLILQTEIETEEYSLKYTRTCVILALVLSIIFTSIASVKQFEKTPIHANPQLVNIANLIKESGYKQGYASFWQADAINFLTNGEVDVWAVHEFNKLDRTFEWLQRKSHAVPPTDQRIFVLIGPNDAMDRDVFLQYMDRDTISGEPTIVYKDDFGYILVEYVQ